MGRNTAAPTIFGLARRDEIVLGRARARGLPVICTLAGGYAQNTDDVVVIHFNLALRLLALIT